MADTVMLELPTPVLGSAQLTLPELKTELADAAKERRHEPICGSPHRNQACQELPL